MAGSRVRSPAMLTAFDHAWHVSNPCLLWALLVFNISDHIALEQRTCTLLDEFYHISYRFSDLQPSWSSLEQERDVGTTEMCLYELVRT